MLFRNLFATATFALAASTVTVVLPHARAQHHGAKPATAQRRNVIVFVADGLRHGAVNATDTPAMLRLRTEGVHFLNSHSLFPTFTTANASAIATGHLLGDTGDYSNTIHAGFLARTARGSRTVAPFVEDDAVLRDLDDHYAGNWLHEDSLIGLARKGGYNTAVLGKLGPVGVQDVAELTTGRAPATVFVDDQTGSPAGIPLRPDAAGAMRAAGLALEAPDRSNGCPAKSRCDNGYPGTNTVPGTNRANVRQQDYFAAAMTDAVLPLFAQQRKPFAILFWSRDPDGTQHNQGDSLNDYTVGINGPTSRAAAHNADNDLQRILDWLGAHPDVAANTDIFLTADHGYATISRSAVDAQGTRTQSWSAGFTYRGLHGEVEVEPHFLPYGFVSIDLAHALGLPLYDPEVSANAHYVAVDPTGNTPGARQRPLQGSGLIGGDGRVPAGPNATPRADVIVAANGGSDLIYVPAQDLTQKRATVERVVAALLAQDYTSAVFVDDTVGRVAGTLPMSAAGLQGSAAVPRPTVVLSFKTFYTAPVPGTTGGDDPLMHAVQLADTGLQQGQGMHGSFARDNTYNNMAALGPDFRAGFADALPVSNADITPTLAAVMHLRLAPRGRLSGRVLAEALQNKPAARRGGKTTRLPALATTASEPTADGVRTVLYSQQFGGERYLDAACLAKGDGPMRADLPCQE